MPSGYFTRLPADALKVIITDRLTMRWRPSCLPVFENSHCMNDCLELRRILKPISVYVLTIPATAWETKSGRVSLLEPRKHVIFPEHFK